MENINKNNNSLNQWKERAANIDKAWNEHLERRKELEKAMITEKKAMNCTTKALATFLYAVSILIMIASVVIVLRYVKDCQSISDENIVKQEQLSQPQKRPMQELTPTLKCLNYPCHHKF